MADLVQTIAGTPIPTLLVIAGILFLLMSVAEKISGHLTIPETRKKQALILGLALLVAGVALSLPSTSKDTWTKMTQEQQSLWSVLGWTAERWANDSPPDTESKDFHELSPDEQEAARRLGFSPDEWNRQ